MSANGIDIEELQRLVEEWDAGSEDETLFYMAPDLARRVIAAEKLVEALEWFENRRLDAIRRVDAIHAAEDEAVLDLCRRHGFGAVMDSAARQWARQPEGSGAFFVGGCVGDTTASASLAEYEATK